MMIRGKKQKRLRRWIAFDGFECKGAEEYLQEMAEKGWLLDEIKGSTYYFVPMEPRKLRYSVKVFDGASVYDLSPSETSLTYAEYCEKAGWHFVGSIGKLHFFYEEQPGAVDIETDAKLELKAVVKYVMIRNWYLWIFFPVFTLLYLSRFRYIQAFTSYIYIITAGVIITMLFFAIMRLGDFLLWLIQNKRRMKNGDPIIYRSRARISFYMYSIWFIVMVYCVVLLILGFVGGDMSATITFLQLVITVGIVVALNSLLRKLQTSGSENIIISIAVGLGMGILLVILVILFVLLSDGVKHNQTVYNQVLKDGGVVSYTVNNDKIPILAKDLGIGETGRLSNEKDIDKTIMAADISYNSNYVITDQSDKTGEEDMGIRYEVFTSPFSWIMGKYKNYKLYHDYLDFPQKWTEVDADIWNASTVYCRHDEVDDYHSVADVRYLVFYPNAVLDFTADKEDLSQKDIKIICDKLHKDISAIPASGDK